MQGAELRGRAMLATDAAWGPPPLDRERWRDALLAPFVTFFAWIVSVINFHRLATGLRSMGTASLDAMLRFTGHRYPSLAAMAGVDAEEALRSARLRDGALPVDGYVAPAIPSGPTWLTWLSSQFWLPGTWRNLFSIGERRT